MLIKLMRLFLKSPKSNYSKLPVSHVKSFPDVARCLNLFLNPDFARRESTVSDVKLLLCAG